MDSLLAPAFISKITWYNRQGTWIQEIVSSSRTISEEPFMGRYAGKAVLMIGLVDWASLRSAVILLGQVVVVSYLYPSRVSSVQLTCISSHWRVCRNSPMEKELVEGNSSVQGVTRWLFFGCWWKIRLTSEMGVRKEHGRKFWRWRSGELRISRWATW